MKINLSHGNGGMETAKLIDEIFMPYFKNEYSKGMEDAVTLKTSGEIVFTTDSFVVNPIFFPGGDIGSLAVCGTVNDISTAGAVPKFLSIGFIIEEGFQTDNLHKIAKSVRDVADEAGVKIVTGDTKVIEGNGGIYINTAGIGEMKSSSVHISDAKDGDLLIVSGDLGDHHACILSSRMGIQNNIKSDVAPLNGLVQALISENINIRGMRDITRGGLATVLCEISKSCGFRIEINEESLPVSKEVSGLSGILGLDPLYMGNEGKMLFIIPNEEAENAINILKSKKYGENATVIGQISSGNGVVLRTKLGGKRILQPLMGEGLPRIC
ncbi:MAG: hydrogenase expression/formation protein HypE [Bacillota bacterium]|nr:hydrogenase expression/formation protein HypE [Bacillota bacterium]